MLTFEEVVDLVGSKQKPLLVAIDGLPLSGKTTLALRLINELGAECVQLDDFVKPEAERPSRDIPSFPFDYIRHDEFVSAVCSLAQNHSCLFHPYDWETGRIAQGCSTLLSWTGESEMQHADANRRRVAA
jgi:hypothetical protein